MDKETLSHYGWIVVMLLCLSVMLAFATPLGKFMRTAAWNYIVAFFDVSDEAVENIEDDKEHNDITLNGSFIITDKDGNEQCYVFMANDNYDAYSLVSTGQTPKVNDRYFRCVNYVNIEERRTVKEMFHLSSALGYDDTVEERQGIQCALLHFVNGNDYSEYASTIGSTARSVYDDLLAKSGSLDHSEYDYVELIAIEKEGYIDMIIVSYTGEIQDAPTDDGLRITLADRNKAHLELEYQIVYCNDRNKIMPAVNDLYKVKQFTPNNQLKQVAVAIQMVNDGTDEFRTASQYAVWQCYESTNMVLYSGAIDGEVVSNYVQQILDAAETVNPDDVDLTFTLYEAIDTSKDYQDVVCFSKINNTSTPTEFGLYDKDNVLLANWDKLVNTYGFDISSNDLSQCGEGTMYYVINNNPELSTGVKLVVSNDVNKIGKYAIGFSPLTTVVLPDSITSIESLAFSQCEDLVSINIPKNVSSIGEMAFIKCYSLKEITIPEGITEIKSRTFYYCRSLEKVTLPDTLTKIGMSAFHSNAFTTIDIPDNVSVIETGAFWHCANLVSIEIPEGVKEIQSTTFANCKSLSSVKLPNGITSIGNQAFLECYSLTSIDLPDELTTIGSETFMDCTSLQTINIPSTVNEIGKDAFKNTPWLSAQRQANPLVIVNDLVVDGANCVGEVIIPSNIKKICAAAFISNDNVTSVVLPEGLTDIKYEAFGWCHNLTSINLPSTLKTIGDNAFTNCNGLVSVVIPNGVESIGNSAYSNCGGLTDFVIADSVKSIGTDVLMGCPLLTTIYFNGTQEQWNSLEGHSLIEEEYTVIIAG